MIPRRESPAPFTSVCAISRRRALATVRRKAPSSRFTRSPHESTAVAHRRSGHCETIPQQAGPSLDGRGSRQTPWPLRFLSVRSGRCTVAAPYRAAPVDCPRAKWASRKSGPVPPAMRLQGSGIMRRSRPLSDTPLQCRRPSQNGGRSNLFKPRKRAMATGGGLPPDRTSGPVTYDVGFRAGDQEPLDDPLLSNSYAQAMHKVRRGSTEGAGVQADRQAAAVADVSANVD